MTRTNPGNRRRATPRTPTLAEAEAIRAAKRASNAGIGPRMTVCSLVERFGLTKGQINRILLQKPGTVPRAAYRRQSREALEQIEDAIRRDRNNLRVARAFGITFQAVQYHRRRMGVGR